MITLKKKPCKGSGKANGYGCGEIVLKRTYGLGYSCGCFYEWLNNTKEGGEYLEKVRIKSKVKVKKEKARKSKEDKDKITDWKNKLQEKVQEIARLIDYDLNCLARPERKGQMHGGHVIAKGGNSQMRFNLHNIHRQSAQSNKWFSDDIKMREGLEREYGKEYLDFVLGLKSYPVPKHSNLEYQEFYKKACKIANRLRKGLTKRTPQERIILRDKANLEIGVYLYEQCVFE